MYNVVHRHMPLETASALTTYLGSHSDKDMKPFCSIFISLNHRDSLFLFNFSREEQRREHGVAGGKEVRVDGWKEGRKEGRNE